MGCLCPRIPSEDKAKNESPAPQSQNPQEPKDTERYLNIKTPSQSAPEAKPKKTRAKPVTGAFTREKSIDGSYVFQVKPSSALSDMNTQYSTNSRVSSKFSTIVKGSSPFERTYSYVQEEGGLPHVLTQAESNGQEVLILNERVFGIQNISKLNSACYSLIGQKMYVRKTTKNHVQVKSPNGEFRLHCHPSLVKETLFLAEGVPMENIRLLNSKCYVIDNNIELEIEMMLRCKQCSSLKKHDYSVALIELNMVCQCGHEDFTIEKLECRSSALPGVSIPLWLNGQKVLRATLPEYEKSEVIRAMGCNECWKFSDDCQPMACGCLRCKDCPVVSSCLLCHEYNE